MAVLCLAAYWPALDNGFISDDYVVLEWSKQWTEDPSFLIGISPDVFRITSYLAIVALKWAFGYQAAWFHGFAILVHFLNCLLVWKLVSLLAGSARTALVAAAFFAVVQNPQEAIMWLAAMGDALAALFVLAALVLWLKEKFLLGALAYTAALFSKESALVFLLLLPLTEY